MALTSKRCFVSKFFLTYWLDFTKTIIPLALMSSESIAHEAEGLRAHSGSRNNYTMIYKNGERMQSSFLNFGGVFNKTIIPLVVIRALDL